MDASRSMRGSTAGLVQLARRANRKNREATIAMADFMTAFRDEFGHEELDDVLVDAIQYATMPARKITKEFIDANSQDASR